MYSNVEAEVPTFLKNEYVYCDTLTHKPPNQISCFLLTKRIQFYEIQRKQLLHAIDLRATCLGKMAQQLEEYEGPKGKWYKQIDDDETSKESQLEDTEKVDETEQELDMRLQPREIYFGKYYHRFFNISKLYLLIRCWDKLVVVQRSATTGFRLIAEYEKVSNFKFVCAKIKFYATVQIQFENAKLIQTDFQHPSDKLDGLSKKETGAKVLGNQKEFKQLLERIRSAKTELRMHRIAIQRKFEKLRDTQRFGCNFLRSLKLEEKQILTRCGDVWMRFTTDDTLVIGLPLVNNCTAPNLTIVKNLKPIFKIDEKCVQNLSFEYRLYQLKQRFADVESLEAFFQSEDKQLQATTWVTDSEQQLLPETFGVLVITLKITQIAALEKCPLLVSFNVEKDLRLHEEQDRIKTRTFELQIFVKNIDFFQLLLRRHIYEISFRKSTLHQDFLAIAATLTETKLAIDFKSSNDLMAFERILAGKFDFKKLVYPFVRVEETDSHTNQKSDESAMEVEKNVPQVSASSLPHTLFYNSTTPSIWYGTLLLREAPHNVETDARKTLWKFYTKGVEKAQLLLKLLHSKFVKCKCNIEKLELCNEMPSETKIIEFENAIREELQMHMELINNRKQLGEKKVPTPRNTVEQLLKLEMKTDLLAGTIS